MALSEYEKNSVICNEGAPLDQILIITNGSVEASFNGRTFHFGPGDMMGICDLSVGIYSCTYIAVSDVTIFSYPYKNLSALEALLKDKPDIANLLVNSMCRQILNLLQYKIALKQEADRAYELVDEIYPQYERLCTLYALAAKKLGGISEVTPFSELDLIDEWVYAYYMEIKDLDQAVRKGFFNNKPGITLGFLRKAAEDAFQVLQVCNEYTKYLEDIAPIFLNVEEHDLFSLIAELHFNSINIKDADAAVELLIAPLMGLLPGMIGINPDYYQKRLDAYKENLAAQRAIQTIPDTPVASGIKRNLADSLDIILEYSECPKETCNKFIRNVQDYAKLYDKGSADDAVYRLRKELTEIFYEIYQQVFIKSLKDPSPPTVIKMFLNFGYVDATLAGHENADYLYSIADSLKGDANIGVYTISEWLTAIYNNQKEPCRNELEEDYPAYIRSLKTARKIDDRDEVRLLADMEEKLRFELKNVFPVINRITHGTISTFCPLFSGHNVQRKLEISLITPALLKETLDEIRDIDFSAYFREVMYSIPEIDAGKEVLHIEVLPDIILMPNVGARGIMWQEIEGRKRTTASRMFMPLFLQGDLKKIFIRLTGEFRWEMCKRIQGVHWNDLSDPSLTSEFCYYLQFYKNNSELSAEIKESIKTELARARNHYKNVFSSNYTDWMTYELNGSSRLNKAARKILFTYCPFSAEIREKLKRYPYFSDLLNRFEFKKQQRVQKLSRVIQKISYQGKTVPQELLNELEYANK